MTRTALLTVIALGSSMSALGQPAPAADPSSGALVRQWVEAVNGLSNAPESLDRFVALYDADALLITGPNADQRGTATYRGPRGIRTWAARVAASEERRSYRLETETARETTASLIHEATGPWGGPAVAVQIVATFTEAATGKRYAVPGAVFFQISGGKIRRSRLFFGDGERAEVEPEPTRRRP